MQIRDLTPENEADFLICQEWSNDMKDAALNNDAVAVNTDPPTSYNKLKELVTKKLKKRKLI